MNIAIKNTSLAERCEICHKSDKFDQITNSCTRCGEVLEKRSGSKKASVMGDLVPASMAAMLICLLLMTNHVYRVYRSDNQVKKIGKANVVLFKENRIDNVVEIKKNSEVLMIKSIDTQTNQILYRDIWGAKKVVSFAEHTSISYVIIHESETEVDSIELHLDPQHWWVSDFFKN